jgi:hypothetical protein
MATQRRVIDPIRLRENLRVVRRMELMRFSMAFVVERERVRV